MVLAWDEGKQLIFGICRKPKQASKYVDTSSMHRPTVFKSVTRGVFTRIAQLTSKSKAMKKMKFNQVYREHTKALADAGVAPKDFPTIGKLQELEEEKLQRLKKKNQQHTGTNKLFIL
eukprot:4114540-Ditylum_brightwellii.AAC.1